MAGRLLAVYNIPTHCFLFMESHLNVQNLLLQNYFESAKQRACSFFKGERKGDFFFEDDRNQFSGSTLWQKARNFLNTQIEDLDGEFGAEEAMVIRDWALGKGKWIVGFFAPDVFDENNEHVKNWVGLMNTDEDKYQTIVPLVKLYLDRVSVIVDTIGEDRWGKGMDADRWWIKRSSSFKIVMNDFEFKKYLLESDVLFRRMIETGCSLGKMMEFVDCLIEKCKERSEEFDPNSAMELQNYVKKDCQWMAVLADKEQWRRFLDLTSDDYERIRFDLLNILMKMKKN